MTGTDHAFTYSPGTSLLHLWGRRGKAFRTRLFLKIVFFFFLEIVAARSFDQFGSFYGVIVNVIAIAIGGLGLWLSCGPPKAKALALEMFSLARLSVLVGIPVLTLVVALTGLVGLSVGYTLSAVPVVFARLVLLLCAMLALASVFMSTTSLADVVSLLPGPRKVRLLLGLALVSFARAEPELVARLSALRYMDQRAGRGFTAKVLDYPGDMFYLLIAVVWQVMAVDSIPVFLSLNRDESVSAS